MSFIERLRDYRTLLDCYYQSELDSEFISMWKPGEEPELTTLSFREFWTLARQFSSLYRSEGLPDGSTVAIILPQGIELTAAFAGAILAGVIPTILAYPNFKMDLRKYKTGLSGVTSNISATLTLLDSTLANSFAEEAQGSRDSKILVIPTELPPPLEETRFAKPSPSDIAVIQHSSGTTGLQKGVALSHGVILRQIVALGDTLEVSSKDRIASWLPLYHDMGLVACFLVPLMCGIPVMMQSPGDWVLRPASFLEMISRYGCTLSWIPNFAFQFLATRVTPNQKSALDLSSARAIVNCSEPVRSRSIRAFESAFESSGLLSTAVQTSYAMAECVFAVTQSDLKETPRTIWIDGHLLRSQGLVNRVSENHKFSEAYVSSGRCLKGSRIRIVGQDGTPLPADNVGEIIVQADFLFDGYFNRPNLTERVLKDGWYWTSDTGFIVDGDVFVIGRRDDTMIVGGRNFYPQDVEEIAFGHPRIRDGRAVAVGIANLELGTEEIVVIAEVAKLDDLSDVFEISKQIREEIVAQLDVTPRLVQVVEPRWLIKSTAGKPARSANRRKLLAKHPEFQSLVEAWPILGQNPDQC
jgi:acyl-CoA synthetase (AMP-forming)/AMP-acid ligase II